MEEIMVTAGSFLLAFLIGSFPTAYIFVRRHSGLDLRSEGSGNIGTLNAYEVSRSRRLGIVVLGVDLLKGATPVLLVWLSLGDAFLPASAALLGVVTGHNYSPWIGWRGGRGLAPAAGAGLVFNPLLPAIWVVFWLAGFLRTRDVHFGNIAATLLAPALVLLFPGIVRAMNLFTPSDRVRLPVVAVLLFGLIFLKHIGPFREMLHRYAQSRNRK